MKNPLLLFCTFLILAWISCSKEADNLPDERVPVNLEEVLSKANAGCGFANAGQSLQWLEEIIVKGEEDIDTRKHMGNYLGRIFLTTYHDQPVFYVEMQMGSGGRPGHFLDCSGKAVAITAGDYPQKGTLVYSNVPPQ